MRSDQHQCLIPSGDSGCVSDRRLHNVSGDGDITVECFDNNGYSAVIEPADYNHGYVAVSVPSHVVSGKVLVYAYDATGRTVMRAPVFEEGVLVGMPEIHEIGGEAQSPSPNTQRAPTAKPPSPSSTATRSCSRFGRYCFWRV